MPSDRPPEHPGPTSDAIVPASVRAELASLVADVEAFAEAEIGQSTRATYKRCFARFERWARARGLPSLPTTPELVAVYLSALATGKAHVEWLSRGGRPMRFTARRKLATLRIAYASIAHAQREAGHDWPRGHPAIVKVMKGIARTFAADRAMAPRKAQALELDMLRRALTNHRDDLLGLRDRAMVLLSWFGALRRSDGVPLDVEDVRFVTEGLVITIRRSKTDQTGAGAEVAVPFASDHRLCPVRALRAWLDAAGIATGPIFRGVTRHGRVSPTRLHLGSMTTIIKGIVEPAGIDPSRLSSHSLRSGFATSASARGKSLEDIMRQGRWKSANVARGYVRHGSLWVKNPAEGLA